MTVDADANPAGSPFNFEAARALPPQILFGTSSWTYPGWQGMVYHRGYSSERRFKSESLEEYARFPWFRTVGIDSTFYGPPQIKTLQSYAAQVPEGFRWISKVWEEITIPRYARHRRYGEKAGRENPNFLNAGLFIDAVLGPVRDSGTAAHAGPFVFQFQTLGAGRSKPRGEIIERLGAFLSQLPNDFRYAVEVRDPELLTPDYFSMLNETGATHCFNHWHRMPPLRTQMKAAADAGGLTADFFVARLLTPLEVSYEEAVRRFSPYNKLLAPNEALRKDVVLLAKRALERNVPAFVVVNNRLEGCAPLSIDLMGRAVVSALCTEASETVG